MQDVFKLITGYGINLDAETQEALNTSDQGNPTATLEAMKSRRVVQLMTKALRDFNPKLAKALIDDRDEVTQELAPLLIIGDQMLINMEDHRNRIHDLDPL